MNIEPSERNFPLGRTFTVLAKTYLGILAEKLEHTKIDRFFYALLLIDKEKGTITQQRLSEILMTDKVTIVRVIDYLSKNGLVKRQVNKSDRREHLLILTSKAEKILPDIKKAYEQTENEALKGISSKRRDDFKECLAIVQRNLSFLPSKKIIIKFNKTKRLTK
jgi:MarR family transcriptional regulator, transcriptional regulator for hemolysin